MFNPLVSLADTLVTDRGRYRPAACPRGRSPRSTGAPFAQPTSSSPTPPRMPSTSPGLTGARPDRGLPRRGRGASLPAGLGAGRLVHALFVGKLIPLHGLETILAAARLAPELRIRVVGSGQLDRLLDGRPPNVEHVPWVEYERLPAELHRASCALGIFGTSDKAARVIPNKAFQALACGTPLVTADTPAARELLRDGESALLVPPGDPQALATALRRLAGRADLADALSAGGLAAYRSQASEDVLGARWRGLIESGQAW